MAKIPKVDIRFASSKLGFLLEPHRYKVLYGGRGAGRSWSFARALIYFALLKPIRALCAREIQNTIRDSVHKLLSDQIELLGLGPVFTIQENCIRVANGSEIIFSGLSTLAAENIKSMEGISIVWMEEAQTVTDRSLDILIPTIRKEGSEIWFGFNPSLETDPVYKRFVIDPPEDCVSILINYNDNSMFPDVLDRERLHCKRVNPDAYENIWLGKCKPAIEGAIFFKEIQAAESERRITRVPYDPLLKVHVVFDLGFNDMMAIGLVQKFQSDIRIIKYIEDSGRTLAAYSADLRAMNLNWGRCWLPHDGFARDFKTGHSSAEIMRSLGWDVPDRSEIVELSIEEGIRTVRLMFPQLIFDRDNTGGLIECIKRYRRQINRQTLVAGAPLHDGASNGADCLRYICINAAQMTNDAVDDYWQDNRHSRYDESSVNHATGY
jgi:phage terminase large subunit